LFGIALRTKSEADVLPNVFYSVKATRIKTILLAASLASATSGISQTASNEAGIYTARGLAKATKGDLKGAIADLNVAIKIDPKSASAYDARAEVELEMGNIQGAFADYNRALALDPKLGTAYSGRGRAKSESGDDNGAITDYNRALKLDPKHFTAYNNRGVSKAELGQLKEATAD